MTMWNLLNENIRTLKLQKLSLVYTEALFYLEHSGPNTNHLRVNQLTHQRRNNLARRLLYDLTYPSKYVINDPVSKRYTH